MAYFSRSAEVNSAGELVELVETCPGGIILEKIHDTCLSQSAFQKHTIGCTANWQSHLESFAQTDCCRAACEFQ